MVEYRVIDKRTSTDKILSQLKDQLGEVKTEYLRRLVDQVLKPEHAPVDTGTYVMAHNIGKNRVGAAGTESSHGKERAQPAEPVREAARQKLYAQIDEIPTDWDQLFFRNSAVHARFVEYGGARFSVIHAPYQTARSLSKKIAEDIVRERSRG